MFMTGYRRTKEGGRAAKGVGFEKKKKKTKPSLEETEESVKRSKCGRGMAIA